MARGLRSSVRCNEWQDADLNTGISHVDLDVAFTNLKETQRIINLFSLELEE